jgi:predicted nucleotidyltransferase
MATNPKRVHEDAAVVEEALAARPDLEALYRFGSTVEDAVLSAGDVDLALLCPRRLGGEERHELEQRFAERLGLDVDLVDLRTASPVLAMQVVSKGHLLVDANPGARGEFEDLVYSRYARLNEERRAILERVSSEGSVYGR